MDEITDLPQLKERPEDSHKGMFGRVLVIGGRVGMIGAPALTGMAALRSGAGLVRIAVIKSILDTVAGYDPCYMTIPLCENNGEIAPEALDCILNACEENDVIAIGPGLGTGRGARRIVGSLIEQDIRLVIDADGLNCLAKNSNWFARRKASIILTPHPGEMSRLWKTVFRGEPPARKEQAQMFAKETGCTVVLKGASTIVSDSEKYYVNRTGNPGMSTAGTGDVLTGMITALAGQGLNDFRAAQLGVYLHGLAGDFAAKKRGQISMTAADVLKYIPKSFKEHCRKKR